jgi:hypothetical protein
MMRTFAILSYWHYECCAILPDRWDLVLDLLGASIGSVPGLVRGRQTLWGRTGVLSTGKS